MERNELSYFFSSKTEACANKLGHVKNNSDSKNQANYLLIYITVCNLLQIVCGLCLINKHLWSIFQEFLKHMAAVYLSA